MRIFLSRSTVIIFVSWSIAPWSWKNAVGLEYAILITLSLGKNAETSIGMYDLPVDDSALKLKFS